MNIRGATTDLPEQLFQFVGGGVEGQVPYVQSIAHFPRFRHDSKRRTGGWLPTTRGAEETE
jgi:hypothetical protein